MLFQLTCVGGLRRLIATKTHNAPVNSCSISRSIWYWLSKIAWVQRRRRKLALAIDGSSCDEANSDWVVFRTGGRDRFRVWSCQTVHTRGKRVNLSSWIFNLDPNIYGDAEADDDKDTDKSRAHELLVCQNLRIQIYRTIRSVCLLSLKENCESLLLCIYQKK